MLLHRFLLLVAIAYLGPGTVRDRSTAPPPALDSGHAVARMAPSSGLIALPTRHAQLSRVPSWRHRIKSVLEDKVAWSPRPVDMGPAERPDPLESRIGVPPIAVHLGSLTPLRC